MILGTSPHSHEINASTQRGQPHYREGGGLFAKLCLRFLECFRSWQKTSGSSPWDWEKDVVKVDVQRSANNAKVALVFMLLILWEEDDQHKVNVPLMISMIMCIRSAGSEA